MNIFSFSGFNSCAQFELCLYIFFNERFMTLSHSFEKLFVQVFSWPRLWILILIKIINITRNSIFDLHSYVTMEVKYFRKKTKWNLHKQKKNYFFSSDLDFKNQSEIVEFIEVEDAKLENAYKNSLSTK